MVHVLLNNGNDSRTTRHSITFSSVEPPYSFTLTLAHRFLATVLDLVPFLCARGLVLIVTTLRPTHRRRSERQQGAWRAAVAAHQPPTAVPRPRRRGMVHAFAPELLGLFPSPEEHHGFPSFSHRYCPDHPPPAPCVSKKVIWCALGHNPSSSLHRPSR